MNENVELVITVNENGYFEAAGYLKIIELIVACEGLIKITAESIGKSKVEFLEKLLVSANAEERTWS